MIRSGAAGPLTRALKAARPPLRASSRPPARSPAPLRPSRLALTAFKPFTTSLQRYIAADHIDIKREKQVAKTPLERHPEEVSTTSSVHEIFHEQGVDESEVKEKDDDMLAGVKHDLVSRPNRIRSDCLMLTRGRKRSRKHSICPRFPRKRSTLA